MKNFLKTIFGFIGFVYFVIAIFAIVCLLKKNEYGLPQFGNTTLVVVDSEAMGGYYDKGDLVILNKPNNDDVKVNDAIFFYDTAFKRNTINVANVTSKDKINDEETTYHVKGTSFSSAYLVGKVDGSAKYPVLGSILNIFTSKWGFLFLVILPFFVLFMTEIVAIYDELKHGKKKNKND